MIWPEAPTAAADSAQASAGALVLRPGSRRQSDRRIMAVSDVVTGVLAVAVLVYVVRRIGRGPLVILGRRLTGSLPLRPLGSEPGAERWFAAGGIAIFAGLGVAALLTKEVGYPITALGLLLVSYTGVLIVLDRR